MTLKKNVTGLAIAQVFTYLLPLLQFPYLTRVLGIEKFGLIMFVLSLVVLLQVITDYGFDLSLTRSISAKNRSKRRLGYYLYQSIFLKSILLIPSLLTLTIVVINSELSGYVNLVIFISIAVSFNAFSPVWLFQGLERIYIYSRIVVTSRVISLILILTLIKSTEDVTLYGVIVAFTSFLVVISCYIVIFYKWKISLVKSSMNNVLKLAKESFEFFLSRVGVSLFASSSNVILGSFGSLTQVAIYSAAGKLYSAGVGVFIPITSPLVPYMNRTKNYELFYRIVLVSLLICVLGLAFGFYFGEDIIRIIFGPQLVLAKSTLDILLISLATSVIGLLFGYPALMPIGKERHANISVILGGITQLMLVFSIAILGLEFTALNVASAFTISNIISTLYRVVVFIKFKYKIVES